jgi:uncharacterized protein (TIGR03435 family)
MARPFFAALLCVIAIAPVRSVQAPEERFTSATVRRGIGPLPDGSFSSADMAKVPPGRTLGMVTFHGAEFIATGVAIEDLIETAYGIGVSGSRPRRFASIEGLPSWSERFDINARYPRPFAPVGGSQEPPELRPMLQRLLAERFRLAARWVPRDKVAYDLLRDGPLGPRLQPCAQLPDACQKRNSSSSTVRLQGEKDYTRSHQMVGVPFSVIVANLEGAVLRPVIDRTGLEGSYRFELRYLLPALNVPMPARVTFAVTRPGTLSAVPPNDAWLAFLQAIRDQLGLRLEPRTVSEEVLVIDRIALPSYD